jgi:hypothetical protein
MTSLKKRRMFYNSSNNNINTETQETSMVMVPNNLRCASARGRGLESNVKRRVGRPPKIKSALHF